MTESIDVELHERLSGLAAAVPVDLPAGVDRVNEAPVRSGPTGRRLALGGVVPVLAVVLIGTLAAGLAKVGPFAPGATDGNGPVLATMTDGAFELSIRSTKARYSPDEPVVVEASLVYRGSGETTIRHAQGASIAGTNVQRPGGPIGFGIVEPVVGDLELAPNWRESCESTVMTSGTALTIPFGKSAAWSGDDPRSDEYRAFTLEPVLRLTEGTWRVYAVAEFAIGECSADPIQLRVDVTIEVAPPSESPTQGPTEAPIASDPIASDPSAPPQQTFVPDASPGQIQPDGSVLDVAEDGAFELRLEAAESVYLANEPMDISAVYRYVGPEASVDAYKWGPLVVFRIDQLDARKPTGRVTTIDYAACTNRKMTRDVYLDASLQSLDWLVADAAETVWANLDLSDSTLRLPAGSWRITASFGASVGSCLNDSGAQHGLQASVDIKVVPTTGAEIELRTASEPSEGCYLAYVSGRLAIDPRSGLGVVPTNGEIMAIMWPFGYSARLEAGGAVLFDPDGRVVAREGAAVAFSGSPMADGAFFACSGIAVISG